MLTTLYISIITALHIVFQANAWEVGNNGYPVFAFAAALCSLACYAQFVLKQLEK